MSAPILSVVVIGRNEGSRLTRCLESIRRMSHIGPFDIIYVDSSSSDGSIANAAAFGAKVIQVTGGRLTAARARNAGWRVSSAPFILFLDGDTIVNAEFVSKAISEFDEHAVKVVWGHRREIHPEASIFNRVVDLDWILPPGPTEFCGGDALMRRDALETAGGFNPELIAGEEPDLCRRIRADGGLIHHVDLPMTGHDLAMTSWRQYWRRALRAGHAYAEIGALYKDSGDPLWRQIARRNAVQACVYMTVPLLMIAAAIAWRSWIPVILTGLSFTALVIRTAAKCGKPGTFNTLILFAIHSHIQQVPIFIGQIRYWQNTRRNRRSDLIEYKETP